MEVRPAIRRRIGRYATVNLMERSFAEQADGPNAVKRRDSPEEVERGEPSAGRLESLVMAAKFVP